MSPEKQNENKFPGLIDKLATDVKPVKALDLPVKRLCKWVGVALFCAAAGLAVAGLRPDISIAVGRSSFWLRAFCLISLCLISALAALALATPGEDKGPKTRLLPMIAINAWAIAIFSALFINGISMGTFKWGFPCALHIALVSIAPGILLFWMIKKASPFKLGWSGLFAMIAAGGVGALARQFSCAIDDPSYILIWHFIPVLVIGALGIWLGQKVLR